MLTTVHKMVYRPRSTRLRARSQSRTGKSPLCSSRPPVTGGVLPAVPPALNGLRRLSKIPKPLTTQPPIRIGRTDEKESRIIYEPLAWLSAGAHGTHDLPY